MTRFVAALLVAAGPVVRVQVDPRTAGAADLGPSRSAASLIRAHREGKVQRKVGLEAIRRAAGLAWDIHQQQGGSDD